MNTSLPLMIYDSLSAEKKSFTPIQPGKIGLYVCGMTVYDACHIGHARGMLCFDVWLRFLQGMGYEVNYVRNITDIDDKIIQRAQQQGVTAVQLANSCIESMHQDCQALGLIPPRHEPRATEYISQMQAMIEQLIAVELAYVTTDGDVCFAVNKSQDYGKLSHRSLDQLLSGVRITTQSAKHNPLDFVLWKHAKPGEPSWDSPWGPGRPGWHIECSAMSTTLLGQPFDMHGGGMDLKFPHHENEIAQAEGAVCEHHYANYWMHIGLVQVNGEKMSKSTGNFLLISQLLQQYPAEVVRYWMISSHYRSPINYSEDNLQQAQAALRRLYNALHELSYRPCTAAEIFASQDPDITRFVAALLDDLNTPLALSCLFKLANRMNCEKTQDPSAKALTEMASLLAGAGQLLGLLQQPIAEFLQGDSSSLDVAQIEALIAKRQQARDAKDWPLADAIRQQLLEQGIELDDAVSGKTQWKKR